MCILTGVEKGTWDEVALGWAIKDRWVLKARDRG